MKARAARPAAPKETTSLAPAPTYGFTGLLVEEDAADEVEEAAWLVPAGVVTAAAELEEDQLAQVEEAATGVLEVALALVLLEELPEALLLLLEALEELAELDEPEDHAPHVEAEVVAVTGLVVEAVEEELDLTAEEVVELEVHAPHVPELVLALTLLVVDFEEVVALELLVHASQVPEAEVVADTGLVVVVVALVVVVEAVVEDALH